MFLLVYNKTIYIIELLRAIKKYLNQFKIIFLDLVKYLLIFINFIQII